MRKALMTALALALVTAACGGGDDGESASETTTTTAAPQTTTTVAETTTTTVAETTTTTEATTTTTTEAMTETTFESTGDPDVDAVMIAFMVAFDSSSPYEEKAQYIDDPTGLEGTVDTYMQTGTTMGGVTVSVSDVTINGDTADVTYDLLFNDNPIYPDQTGTAVLIDDMWKVPRDVFCGLMASARSNCPVN